MLREIVLLRRMEVTFDFAPRSRAGLFFTPPAACAPRAIRPVPRAVPGPPEGGLTVGSGCPLMRCRLKQSTQHRH